MSASRKAFLAATALVGTTSELSAIAVAATGERAIMVTLWVKSKDPEAFDKYYTTTHAPLVKQLAGVTSYEISKGPVIQESSQPSPYQMISVIGFDSMNALTAAIESPAGKAMVNDLKIFRERLPC